MYKWLIVLGMIAIGYVVWRLLQRQEGGAAFPRDDEPDDAR